MFEARISAGAKENYLQKLQGNLMQKRYLQSPMTCHAKNVWKDIANLRMKRLNKFSKLHLHACMAINFWKKKMSQHSSSWAQTCDFREYTRPPPDVDFESRSLAKSESGSNPNARLCCVSHNNTAFVHVLRMDSIHALTLWDLAIEVFHSAPNKTDGPKATVKPSTTPSQSSTPTSLQTLITFHPMQSILTPILC